MEEKSLALGAKGRVGFRQEVLGEEGVPGRVSVEQKGPNPTSVCQPQPSSPDL